MPTIVSGVLFFFVMQSIQQAQTMGKVGLTIGTFMAFDSAFKSFIHGTTDISNTITDMLQILPQWQRAQPILKAIPEVELDKADPGKLIGRITVDRVCFRYRQDGPLNLDKVSIHAEPGEFIALVGGSGSGKSTIFRLLLGFETPEEGSIYYDGQDLSGLDVGAVRRQLGVVLQAGKMMAGSIFDNLAGGANISLDEAWEAAKMSGFADDVAAMPMGMHTVVSEGGGNLSGGQRQRLLIAKALVLKPRILMFDEATSALDNRTQAIVSENLEKLKVTRLVIAHRLSTIRNADRIYVMQSGSVAQQGSFEELAEQEGLFTNLMQRQMV
jgi:ATP-binding cassette subfamily C protein